MKLFFVHWISSSCFWPVSASWYFLGVLDKALESPIFRPFAGWQYCFHGIFLGNLESVTQGKKHSD